MARLLDAVPFDERCIYQSCALGELIADALCAWASSWDRLDQLRPHVCLMPTSAIGRSGLAAGELSDIQLAELLPPDRLVRATIGHGALRRLLRRSAAQAWEACDCSAWQVSGLRFEGGCLGEAAELLLESGGESPTVSTNHVRIAVITLQPALIQLGLNESSGAVERLQATARDALAAYVRARTPLDVRSLAEANPHPGRLALRKRSCALTPPCAQSALRLPPATGARLATVSARSLSALGAASASGSSGGSAGGSARGLDLASAAAFAFAWALLLVIAACASRRQRAASARGEAAAEEASEETPLCGGRRRGGARAHEASTPLGTSASLTEGAPGFLGASSLAAAVQQQGAAAYSCRAAGWERELTHGGGGLHGARRLALGSLRLVSNTQLGD